jgi:hypothetical protein
MSRTRGAKLDYWLLCDIVRREDNGKLVIVGLYTPDILVREVPFTLPVLSFLFKWDLRQGPLRKGHIVLKDSDRKQIASIPIDEKAFGESRESGVFVFGISPFGVKKLGTFTLSYKVGSRSKPLGSFRVLLQQSTGQTSPS